MFDLERNISLPEAELYYDASFLKKEESKALFERLLNNIKWRQSEILMFGKRVKEPRLTAAFGNPGKKYCYSGITLDCLPWTAELFALKEKIETTMAGRITAFDPSRAFNTVLLNYYRDGSDSMGWHSDDEKELGRAPVIASITLGESRRFLFRRKDDISQKYELLLASGSLLIMHGQMQHFWSHSIPKERQKNGARLNLTYRYII